MTPTIIRNAGSPPPRRKAGRKRLYRFDQLGVGDALFVPLAGRTVNRIDVAHNRVRSAAHQYSLRYAPNARFDVRVVGDAVGCWRVS